MAVCLINRVIGIFRHLKRFGYIRCNITLSFVVDSHDRDFSASCIYPDIQCIIHCLLSDNVIILVTHMNFPMCGRQIAVTSIQLTTKSGSTRLPDQSAGREWLQAAVDCCLNWSGTVRYWRWRWMNGADVFMHAFEPQWRRFGIFPPQISK